MQKIIVAGCLGQDAKVSEPREGRVAINFSVAVNTRRGETETTTWYSCALWRDEGKATVAQHLLKGVGVIVEGTPDLDVWKDKNTGEAKGALRVNVHNLEFMSGTAKKEADKAAAEAAE